MEQTKYLVVGSSHAALEALAAIRTQDPQGSLTVVTRDRHLPYSPTVLPYILSGRSPAERVFLQDGEFFSARRVRYQPGRVLAQLQPGDSAAQFADGSRMQYEKLLLATGAAPAIPLIPGIDEVRFHVLRTLDDALGLKAAVDAAPRQAVVLGGGLVGMHAAENLVAAGVRVTIVELQDRVLGGYFDNAAARLIERAFVEHGARILTGRRVAWLAQAPSGVIVGLEDGQRLETDLLLVSTGVRPEIGYLSGSGIATQQGICVDDAMRTNIENVWAAGDCAQARDFFSESSVVNAILPNATEQGRIAGMGMSGDQARKDYTGAVPINTYRFFGRHAISVGIGAVPSGAAQHLKVDEAAGRYLRVIVQDGRLLGISSIGEFFDAGIMWQLILRRVDLTHDIERLLADPLAVGREYMSRLWR
jgi:phenylglyoxylate dehydrogenase epsilon subunit